MTMMASNLRPRSPAVAKQRSNPTSSYSQSTPWHPSQPSHPLPSLVAATAAATLLLSSPAWATPLPAPTSQPLHATSPSGQPMLIMPYSSSGPQAAPLPLADTWTLVPSQAPSAHLPLSGGAQGSLPDVTGLQGSEVYVRGWSGDNGFQSLASTSAWADDRPWAPPPPRRPQPTAAPSGSAASAAQVQQALACLQAARQAVDQGRYSEALEQYNFIIQQYPDFALSEYARVGRAMVLYQVGQTSDAILALEDESITMVGSAEIHAALAALLYTERPGLAFRAEEEWEIASSFDKRYADMEFVRSGKHWPERLVLALEKFLSMQS